MSERSAFPNYFYSNAPLSQEINCIDTKSRRGNSFYWALSLIGDLQNEQKRTGFTNLTPYDDNDSEMLDCSELEEQYEINPTKSGKYITAFYVPNSLHSVIIGRRGSKLKEIQSNTNTLVKVPKSDEESIVKIMGQTERSVASARTQIMLLLLLQREKMTVTHFISIPMCSDEIRTNFLKFKQHVLNEPLIRDAENLFQKPEKLHLTIATLVLLDDREIEEAKSLLVQLQEGTQRICRNKKLKILLQGLEIMNDDPTQVNVLYGKVNPDSKEDDDMLQEVADAIAASFSRKGCMKKQHDSIKLHVTLMNSIFQRNSPMPNVKDGEAGNGTCFNATDIISKYGNYYFGKTVVDKIFLSVRFTSAPTGYYHSCASINL